MTLEEYFNNPILRENPPTKVDPHPSLRRCAPEPFMDGLTAKFSHRGAVAYDGEREIAHFTSMYGHFVEPEYRGRGIGTRLVLEWFKHNPDWRPTHRATRTEAGQASYRKVWRMLTESAGAG